MCLGEGLVQRAAMTPGRCTGMDLDVPDPTALCQHPAESLQAARQRGEEIQPPKGSLASPCHPVHPH